MLTILGISPTKVCGASSMTESSRLKGKTFDQQLQLIGGDVRDHDIGPNLVIDGTIVLEPIENGTRVTGRDAEFNNLWGCIASKGLLSQHPFPVAVYDKLRELVNESLKSESLPHLPDDEPVKGALTAIAELETHLAKLKRTVTVKNISEKTKRRAATVGRIVRDATKSIRLEADSFG